MSEREERYNEEAKAILRRWLYKLFESQYIENADDVSNKDLLGGIINIMVDELEECLNNMKTISFEQVEDYDDEDDSEEED